MSVEAAIERELAPVVIAVLVIFLLFGLVLQGQAWHIEDLQRRVGQLEQQVKANR